MQKNSKFIQHTYGPDTVIHIDPLKKLQTPSKGFPFTYDIRGRSQTTFTRRGMI